MASSDDNVHVVLGHQQHYYNGEVKSILNLSTETVSTAINAAKSLFTGMNSSVKTPISLLQEICTKCSLQPVYEMIGTEGQIHTLIYVFQVSVGDIHAIGKGTSKKRAKHQASFAVLNEIRLRSIGRNDELASQMGSLIQMIQTSENENEALNNSKTSTKSSAAVVDDSAFLTCTNWNPVGELLEITQKYAMRPPVFEFGPEEGPPHNRQFICYIILGDTLKETGVGRSKKDAKRQAAVKLINQIRVLKADTDGVINGNANILSKTPHHKEHHGRRLHKNFQNTFNLLKTSDKPLVKALLSSNNLPYDDSSELNRKLLNDLRVEHNFEIFYFEVPALSYKGQYQILLQLKVHPVTVLQGVGGSFDEAKRRAAYNALAYIKLLCSS